MYQYNYRAEQLPPKNPEFLQKPHKFKIDVMDPSTREAILIRKDQDSVAAGRAKRVEELPNHSDLVDKSSWNGSTSVPSEQNLRHVKKRVINLKNYTPPHELPLPKGNLAKTQEDYEQPIHSVNRETYRVGQPKICKRSRNIRNKHLIRKTYHSGVFAFNENEGLWMWSDTGSCIFNSTGDIIKVKDPTAPNFASPTTVK
mmetsp:Transcript_6881/g.8242  ORF Transcript_6881/g.8242 Transcript_6881/m.8242 type:complete len:200 (-) Transcript_6881:144-743(-)